METQSELAKWGLEGSVFLVKPRLGWKEADASEFWMQLQVTELGRTLMGRNPTARPQLTQASGSCVWTSGVAAKS